MFKDLFLAIFSPHSDFGDRCIALFSLLSMFFLVALLALAVFYVADSFSINATSSTTAMVERKEIVPPHVSTTLLPSGKVVIPISTHHPESYHLYFKIDGRECHLAVEKKLFDGFNIGDRIEVSYGFSRIMRTYMPVAVRVAEK